MMMMLETYWNSGTYNSQILLKRTGHCYNILYQATQRALYLFHFHFFFSKRVPFSVFVCTATVPLFLEFFCQTQYNGKKQQNWGKQNITHRLIYGCRTLCNSFNLLCYFLCSVTFSLYNLFVNCKYYVNKIPVGGQTRKSSRPNIRTGDTFRRFPRTTPARASDGSRYVFFSIFFCFYFSFIFFPS